MKGRSNRLPTSDPPDDWVNGSWTVDCICGVNFDDGEEMVNCDECGVWVHTRCSRFVRGEKSFACDKCKSKTSRNDSEETEVAQLLVELPTKTIKMNNNIYPSSNPSSGRPYRLWTDRPIEQRVHVQGIPGGDPSLFQGFSSIFTPELWKCTGYVPKKFNFCYKEFPCWDKQQDINAKAEGDTDNPADKGAGVLYSLSKETVAVSHTPIVVSMTGQVKPGGSDKKASKDRKWEGGDSKNSSVHNLVKKEKVRPIVLQCGKRSREDLGLSKDRSGKKKPKAVHKDHDSKKDRLHASKPVVIHSTNARQEEVHESKAQKATKADVLGDKHGHGKDAGSLEITPNTHLTAGCNTEKLKSDAATDEGNSALRSCEVSGLDYLSDKRFKAEKLGNNASDPVHNFAKTEAVLLPSLDIDSVGRNSMKKEGLVVDDVDRNQEAHTETLTSELLKSQSLVEDVANAAKKAKDTEGLKNLETNTQLGSAHCNIKTKADAFVDNLKEAPKTGPSNIVAKSHGIKYLTEQVSFVDHEPEKSKVRETVPTSCHSSEYEGRQGDESLKAVTGCQYRTVDGTATNPCDTKLECEVPESSIRIQKILSDPKEVPRSAEDTSQKLAAIHPPPTCEQKMVSCGKSSLISSTVISRSSISDKNTAGHMQNPSSIGKRVMSNFSMSSKKENAAVEPIKDEDKHEKPKSVMKDNSKLSKASQPSRASTSPIFKHYTSVGKDSLRHPFSKSSSVESSSLPLDVGEHSAHALHVQNKIISPVEHQRDEKVPQPNLQSSSKSTQSSLGHTASSTSPAGLSDEELALLLHQELNSSPRVPRVPRVRHAGSLPQLSSVCATSMLTKRTTSSGGKDQYTFSRRKSKDSHKDGSRSTRERDSEARKADRVPSSPDSAKTSDALTQMESNSDSLHSARKNVEPASTSAANGGPSSTDANELKSTRDVNNLEDESGTKGVAPTYRTLPGLIAEIMGKGRRMTYEELCNAVLPHWQNLRKHNGERYAYSSHSQAVLDCLRNRTEWARLVDRGPKTNAGRKKRKIDAEPPNTESEDGEDRTFKDGDSKSIEPSKEEFPKGRRNARNCRRLQGRGVKGDRKRRKIEVASDDTGSFSISSEGNVSSDDDSQGSGMCAARSEVSASSDGLAATS